MLRNYSFGSTILQERICLIDEKKKEKSHAFGSPCSHTHSSCLGLL